MDKTFKYNRLSRDDAVLLLVDHQAGLISLVQDFSPNEFKNNVLALVACGSYFRLPTILTTSFEDGPNGPLVPEIKDIFFPMRRMLRVPATSTRGTMKILSGLSEKPTANNSLLPAWSRKSVSLFRHYLPSKKAMKCLSLPMLPAPLMRLPEMQPGYACSLPACKS